MLLSYTPHATSLDAILRGACIKTSIHICNTLAMSHIKLHTLFNSNLNRVTLLENTSTGCDLLHKVT